MEMKILEPKIFAPHEFKEGRIPRKVLVERKRREFNQFMLNEHLEKRGAFSSLIKMKADTVFYLPLELFDNEDYEYRPISSWIEFLHQSAREGLKARAMKAHNGHTTYSWEPCIVNAYKHEIESFQVTFTADSSVSVLKRLFICFDTEDPQRYSDRIMAALMSKATARNMFALQLYVDCMPVDFLRPLEPEQVNRILEKALSTSSRNSSSGDPNLIVEQYNLNHMRTMNQLILTHKMRTQPKEISTLHPLCKDPSLFESLLRMKDIHRIEDYPNAAFLEVSEAIKFNSAWNRRETISIMQQVQIENLGLEKSQLFQVPEKTVRAEEFASYQQTSLNQVGQFVRETWLANVTQAMVENLKNIKKGWFNIEEANVEVYVFSKLKRFMARINFMMEDSVRIMLTANIKDYCASIKTYCPASVLVISNSHVKVIASRHPLFTVDLKFVEKTNSSEAKFSYSILPDALVDVALEPITTAFSILKNLTQVERRVMVVTYALSLTM